MASLRVIRRRIRSIQNTSKVTRAMEMVAASRMRHAQSSVIATRPYSAKIREVIAHLSTKNKTDEQINPLLETRTVENTQVIQLTPDRGLCGGLHSNLNRTAIEFYSQRKTSTEIIAVGKKGRDFMLRHGPTIKAEFTDMPDRPQLSDILPIATIAINDYTAGTVDEVHIVYPKFISIMNQEILVEKLLPIEPPEDGKDNDFIYEPNPKAVLSTLLPRFIEMQIYQAMLELVASEQSARMVAMRNATENANEIVDDLTLELNKARQESITSELLDIISGVAALAN